MKNIFIIIKKQLKDTLKNKVILIQFILFPVMAIIMEKAIIIENMPEMFFLKLFSIMYIGMAPITSVASIIAEEKETNTLRVLMMANVKSWQYLIGVGFYVLMICMIGALVTAVAVGLTGEQLAFYLTMMCCGFIISILAGAGIGMFAKNQMSATSLVMPGMMILAFAPMLSIFNEKISKFANILYTEQIKQMFEKMSFDAFEPKSLGIISANALVMIVLFVVAYKKKGLE